MQRWCASTDTAAPASGQFTPRAKLCLPKLVSQMQGGACCSVQVALDRLIGSAGIKDIGPTISAVALILARKKLHAASLIRLNKALIQQSEHHRFAHRYKGLRVIAGDASDVYSGIRIEKAFRRLKHQVLLVTLSGLTEQASRLELTAKVINDNQNAVACTVARTIDPCRSTPVYHKRCRPTETLLMP